MSLVVSQKMGEILFLQYIVGLVEAGNPVLHLYTSLTPDPTVDPSSSVTIGAITECSAGGYHAITLISANWTVGQDISGLTSAVYSGQTFSFGTNATIYGYFVTDTSGNLLWLEKFPSAPFLVPPDGGTITIEPTISMND
jgi:hypothetical protein